ncbi:MAG: VWA domain-containing protein [bacterium]
MTFANPYFLLLLPLTLAAGWIAMRLDKSSRSALLFPFPSGIPAVPSLRSSAAAVFPYVSRTLVLILLVLALARPQKVSRGDMPPSEGVEILLCIDTSTSMQALDFDPYNRLEAAKKAAREFISKRTNDRIGIVVFAANALLQCPLTLDYESLLEFLDDVSMGMTRSDGTAIGDAISVATGHLKTSPAKSKVLILLTDGRSNTGVISDPVLAAKAAAAYDIRIYTIGTAGKGPARVPVNDPVFGTSYAMQPEDLDEGTLLAIASASSGEFFRATNYGELQNIYKRIDSLEKTEFKGHRITSYSDRYLLFLIPALLILMAEAVFLGTLLVRIP